MNATMRILAMGGLLFFIISGFTANSTLNTAISYRAHCMCHGGIVDSNYIWLGPDRGYNKTQASKDWERHSEYYHCKNGGLLDNVTNRKLYYYQISFIQPYPHTLVLYY